MMTEYVAIAGMPTPSDPWPMVMATARRAGMHEARHKLTLLDSVSLAISGAMGGGIEMARQQLVASAYPSAGAAADPFVPNIFAEGSDGE